MSNALLRCQDVHQMLGRGEHLSHVLHGVSLDVHAGEFVALTGSSGSGKSTLLYICGALDKPTSGQVFFQGQEMTSMPDNARATFRGRHLGYIFQFHFLLPEFTVIENVALPLERQGLPSASCKKAAMDALEVLGLTGLAGRRPTQLSGGQQQRVAIARAIVHKPALLLADEPTGSLDSRNAAAVFWALEHLTRAFGTAVVMVTHDPSLAASCDRWVTLADGRIVGEKRRGELVDSKPASTEAETSRRFNELLELAEEADAETVVMRRDKS